MAVFIRLNNMLFWLISWLNIFLNSETSKIGLVYKAVAGFAGVLVSMRFVEQGHLNWS
jgi:hypothetical protein